MYHFSNQDCLCRYGDGRKIVAGETLTVDCEPILCERGLHASPRIIDALDYAPDFMLWEVELGGTVIHDKDKSVATKRTALWGFYAKDVILAWTRRVALDALTKYWDTTKLGPIDPVILDFLRTGNNARAASAAANAFYAAAGAAADAAAAGAAYAAVGAAAGAAVYAAAAYARAAGAAAYARAAGAAAYAAAKDEYEKWLVEMIAEARGIYGTYGER